MVAERLLKSSWEVAKERYAAEGVDAQKALERLKAVSVSLHCWQGDDVRGFETPDVAVSGGLAATGNYPGRARNADELRRDVEKVMTLVPGRHRFNLHAMYAETGDRRVERNGADAGAFRAMD